MKENDPRYIKTRENILISFEKVIQQKSFEKLTVKDITDKAKINRATFYSHFLDKYDLLEYSLRYSFMKNVINTITNMNCLNENTVKDILFQIVEFNHNLSTKCPSSYQDFYQVIQNIMITELQNKFIELYRSNDHKEVGEISAIALSWMVCGLADYYFKTKQDINMMDMKAILGDIYRIDDNYHLYL